MKKPRHEAEAQTTKKAGFPALKKVILDSTKVTYNSFVFNRDELLSGLKEPAFGPESISFDSWKMRIPRHLVSIQDENLTSRWVHVNEATGEIDERRARENVLYRECPGYTVKWQIEKQVTGRRSVDEFLTVGVPSKLLGGRYFEGITIDNIELVYNALMAQKVASFSFNDFMDKSACTDIDLKQDFIYRGDFPKDLHGLYAYVKPSKYKGKGCRIFTAKDNQGIEFSDRATTSFKLNPFLKIYHKGIELSHNSPTFTRTHLGGVDFHNVVRKEATLKNRKHMRHLFGHEVHTPYLLVRMPHEDKKRVFDHAIEAHLGKRARPKRKEWPALNGQKLIIYELIRQDIAEGKAPEVITERILSLFERKQERYRYKKMLDELFDRIEAEKASEFIPILDDIFWN